MVQAGQWGDLYNAGRPQPDSVAPGMAVGAAIWLAGFATLFATGTASVFTVIALLMTGFAIGFAVSLRVARRKLRQKREAAEAERASREEETQRQLATMRARREGTGVR